MAFDQENRLRIARDGLVEAVGNRLQFRGLIGRNIPRSGFEGDAVEIDAPHALAHCRAVADFIERIAAVDPFHRGRDQRVVDQFGRSVVGFDDVAVARDCDHRRRQCDEEAADRAGRDRSTSAAARAVVDQDNLAATLIAADTAKHPAVAIVQGDDLRAIRPHNDGAGVVAGPFLTDVTRAVTEAILLVVPDE